MPKDQKLKPDDEKQSQRFVETAHQLETDESGKPFERALKKMIVVKPAKKSPE
jgi:hypothetical protein